MDFESPDVERDFPGLYLSESGSGKRSQDSDFSDDAHERSTKKDLLIGKRKDKKESKKDQGYAALEGESSPEEDLDVKSPCKSKKSKSFKFPTIKEKREKSREKDVKEKEREKEKEKDKDVDRDKEKKKESKSKLKLKDKKKVKTGDDSTESVVEMPVFGVPISVATERSHCHDGVEIPVVVRDCIDHVQECGLGVDGIYKVAGVKSKVQQLRRSYNKREMVKLGDYDLPTVTSLLKTFLRELPESLLTTDLAPRFEDVSNLKEFAVREHELSSLIVQLPLCNRTCLSWIIRHLENVAANECQNKMGISALGTVLGPVLQTSPRLVSVLVIHCTALFPNVKLVRYIPPLSASCTSLPSSREAIAAELVKQESLLNQIHSEMNNGCTIRSDQLWEVQRFITLLKRKLRSLEKAQEATNQAVDKAPVKLAQHSAGPSTSTTKAASISPSVEKIDFALQVAPEKSCGTSGSRNDVVDVAAKDDTSEAGCLKDEVDVADSNEHVSTVASIAPEQQTQDAASTLPPPPYSEQADKESSPELEEKSATLLQVEHGELLKLQNYLVLRITQELEEIETLQGQIKAVKNTKADLQQPTSDARVPSDVTEIPADEANTDNEAFKKEVNDLSDQIAQSMQERMNLVRQIMLEREACIRLRTQLKIKQETETK